MKKLSAYQVLEILFPVAFHYGMMLLAAMLTGNFLDAASQTTLAALLALPFLWMLYKKEPKPEKKYSRRSLWLLPFVGMAGNTLFSLILNVVHLTEHFSNASQEALFQSNLLVQIIGIGLFVPFVEELVFRGLVYGKMRRLFSFRRQPRSAQRFLPFIMETSFSWFMPFPWDFFWPGPTNAGGSLSAPVLLHIGANLLGILETVIRGFSIR